LGHGEAHYCIRLVIVLVLLGGGLSGAVEPAGAPLLRLKRFCPMRASRKQLTRRFFAGSRSDLKHLEAFLEIWLPNAALPADMTVYRNDLRDLARFLGAPEAPDRQCSRPARAFPAATACPQIARPPHFGDAPVLQVSGDRRYPRRRPDWLVLTPPHGRLPKILSKTKSTG
jgi:hypothetical protein